MFAILRRFLRKGDIVVADRGFWSFANLAFLALCGVDMIVRTRYADKVDWSKGKSLGKDDRVITMKRPADKEASRVMSKRMWHWLPTEITVRQVRAKVAVAGFRTKELLITTTLLDPLKWPAETLVAFGGADQCKRCPRAATRVIDDGVSGL